MLEHPHRLLWIATALLLLGVILPFLMVVHILESTFFLNFLSFTASMLGSLLGFAGIALTRLQRNRRHSAENSESDHAPGTG